VVGQYPSLLAFLGGGRLGEEEGWKMRGIDEVQGLLVFHLNLLGSFS